MLEEISAFRNYLVNEKNASENTVEAYIRDVSDFADFLCTEQIAGAKGDTSAQPDKVKKDHIRRYLYTLHDKYSSATINRKLATLRTFFHYLRREGVVTANPAKMVKGPKKSQRLPEHLTVDEAFSLVKTPLTANRQLNKDKRNKARTSLLYPDTRFRDTALLELLYSTGARVSEITNADYGHIEEGFKAIKLYGKGRKERIAAIGEKAKGALKKYINQRAEKGDPLTKDRPLFLNKHGKRLSRQSIYKLVRDLSIKAGMYKDISPHGLRHTFATHMLGSGAGLREIQKMLGHANLNTTVRYTHVSLQQMIATYDKAHPHGFDRKKERRKK